MILRTAGAVEGTGAEPGAADGAARDLTRCGRSAAPAAGFPADKRIIHSNNIAILFIVLSMCFALISPLDINFNP
jgi:hypothetical protein